jgi:hypothetical protein
VNRLTHRDYDPVAKIPEFKVSAVRIEKVSGLSGASKAASPHAPAYRAAVAARDLGESR